MTAHSCQKNADGSALAACLTLFFSLRADVNDPDKIAKRTEENEDRFLSPFIAAERGYIDDFIVPHSTRSASPGRWR